MIKSFKHKGLEQFFLHGVLKGINTKHSDKIADILDLLDAADSILVMNFPGSGLHKLEPKSEKLWAIKVLAIGE